MAIAEMPRSEIEAALRERSAAVDTMVRREYAAAALDVHGLALAAVGGYGRQELFPYSDVDLLIVQQRDRDASALRESVGLFLRSLWDSGLRVSQSVHSVDSLSSVDDANVELNVSLLDRRFLAGDRSLYDSIRDPKRERLAPALVKLGRTHHTSYGNTIFHLEPNVKEAPGGLRDLQLIRWLARLDHATGVIPAHDLLFRIRDALHHLAKRDQNVLGYERQDKIAEEFNITASKLMSEYFREARPICAACVRALDQEDARRSRLFATFLDRPARLSTADFSVIRGEVYFRAPQQPEIGLGIFTFIARHGLRLSSDAEKRIEDAGAAPLVWAELRGMLDLPHATAALRAMHASGYLSKVLPEFAAIDAFVIRDFYHRYTVDEHTLVAIENAAALRARADSFGEIARETPDWPTVLIALLLHDVGKAGMGESHARESVRMARQVFERIGMPEGERRSALFLIEQHLAISRAMTTRNPDDPATAVELARLCGTVERLRQLTVVTWSDIGAVNPSALTDWRKALLWRLYVATSKSLLHALHDEPLEEGLPARYRLTHSSEEIDLHHRMEREGRLVHLERVGAHYRLTVVVGDKPFLLAQVAGALAGFGMSILRAEAFVNDRRFAVDTFQFADPIRTLELNPGESDRLLEVIADVLTGKRDVREILRGRPQSRLQMGSKTRASFDNHTSRTATLFEITAEDRPGLLYDLTRTIAEAGCNIDTVLIDTEGRKAIDVFYVTREGAQLDNAEAASLVHELMRY